MPTTQTAGLEHEHLCALAQRAGRAERCPGAECPLWENGVCALEEMTVAGELEDDPWSNEAD